MSARRAGVRGRTRAPAVPMDPVRTAAERGWLSPTEAVDLLRETFGATVSTRTIQVWTRNEQRPLLHVRIGHRLLVARDDLLARVTT